jgi:broad specificity phosphatase PhoE
MKTVYFVRHGETDNNAAKVYQDGFSKLSEKGKRQAEVVAERFTRIPVDVVISSDMDRALETAQFIAKRVDKELILSSLFREMLRPSVIWNRSHSDPEVKTIRQFTDDNFGNTN